jgi:hypothetical protein
MTASEFDQILFRLQDVNPFSPFTVELIQGERFVVDRPTVAVRDGNAVFLGPGGASIWFDHHRIKRFIHTS